MRRTYDYYDSDLVGMLEKKELDSVGSTELA